MTAPDYDTLRAVAREHQPDWSDEQFEAHWSDYIQKDIAIARGLRKQAAKRARGQ